ncbi:MAG: glycosyltransferase [Aggregatilineales bacterium]
MLFTLLTLLYQVIALLLAVYTVGQLLLLWHYLRSINHPTEYPEHPPYFPSVTIQLPVYNERHVVTRLLDAVVLLDYPPEQLHIQVLDDSDDETYHLIASHINLLQQQHIHIEHVRRPIRDGYKAGALAYGLSQTDSDFIAIFDADFVPPPDFLQRTLAILLADDRYGVVQTRWGHLNDTHNALTRAQALSVDTHFWIEQTGRHQAGYFLPFNGTGGVWRRACIEDAGGWSWDTLTEDLDLSYRAQLRGWQAKYLPDMVVPGELPSRLNAYRQQQARWAMGSTQSLIKLTPQLLRTRLPFMTRLMAFHHLAQYLPQPLILLLLILTPIVLISDVAINLTLPGLMAFVPPFMYLVTQRRLYANPLRRLAVFPVLLLIATGLTWSNTKAILQASNGQGRIFRRTPKFADATPDSDYALRETRLWGEWALLLFSCFCAWLAWIQHSQMLVYLLLYIASFALIIVRQKWESRQAARHQQYIDNTTSSPDAVQSAPIAAKSWHKFSS